jgi:hypothetical protein
MKYVIASVLTASMLTLSTSAIAQNYNYAKPQLQGKVSIIPMGTTLSAVTTSELSSENLTVGDSVTLTLGSPFYYKGALVAPVNSNILGLVVTSQAAGRGDRTGKLKIKFKEIITPDGQRIPISGKVITNDGTGLLMGVATKEKMKEMGKNVAIGSAGGALSGLVFGSMAGGNAGKGTALGTALGAGLGLGKTLIDKGADVCIPAGAQLNIMLDQPATVNY